MDPLYFKREYAEDTWGEEGKLIVLYLIEMITQICYLLRAFYKHGI